MIANALMSALAGNSNKTFDSPESIDALAIILSNSLSGVLQNSVVTKTTENAEKNPVKPEMKIKTTESQVERKEPSKNNYKPISRSGGEPLSETKEVSMTGLDSINLDDLATALVEDENEEDIDASEFFPTSGGSVITNIDGEDVLLGTNDTERASKVDALKRKAAESKHLIKVNKPVSRVV